MFLYKVEKTFKVKDRGYILTPGYSKPKLDENLKIKIGDSIKLQFPDGSYLATKITGINFNSCYDILIDSLEDIPIGTEIWLINQ
ncbi:MAG: hypothetical protein JNM88_20770 [Chitinophagaceae bacterium]|nr:hypothetical protein [Chitinophagaceae bacterium]